jgi:hypothetical protein
LNDFVVVVVVVNKTRKAASIAYGKLALQCRSPGPKMYGAQGAIIPDRDFFPQLSMAVMPTDAQRPKRAVDCSLMG